MGRVEEASAELPWTQRLGFLLLATFLATVALASAVDVGLLLLASLVAFSLGLVLVIRASPSSRSRLVGFLTLVYLVVLLLAFVAASPITIGESREWNSAPLREVVIAAEALMAFLPYALALGVAFVVWQSSRLPGRILVGTATALLAGSFLLSFLSTPRAGSEGALAAARAVAALSANALSAACLALVGAILLLVYRPNA